MARKDRTGNRKSRDQRRPLKIPALGYYLIVTDTLHSGNMSNVSVKGKRYRPRCAHVQQCIGLWGK